MASLLSNGLVWAAVLGFILVAGCLRSNPSSGEGPESVAADANVRTSRAAVTNTSELGSGQGLRTFRGEWNLTLTGAAVLATGTTAPGNCVLIQAEDLRILDGNTSAEWVKQTDAADRMELVIADTNASYMEASTGTSPFYYGFSGLPDSTGYTFSLEPAGAVGASREQSIHFVLTFDYLAANEPSATYPC